MQDIHDIIGPFAIIDYEKIFFLSIFMFCLLIFIYIIIKKSNDNKKFIPQVKFDLQDFINLLTSLEKKAIDNFQYHLWMDLNLWFKNYHYNTHKNELFYLSLSEIKTRHVNEWNYKIF